MKAKIQRSMLLVLFVTILIFYGLLTLVMYQKNLTLLKEEVNQEARYIRTAVDISGPAYLKEMDGVDIKTRVTRISTEGKVLYDSGNDAETLENHSKRPEVKEALASGTGEDVRVSGTVGKEMYYYAILLQDGSVLRVAKTMDNLGAMARDTLPVIGVLAVVMMIFAWILGRWQTERLIRPINELDIEHRLFFEMGADKSIIDGALGRKSLGARAVAEGVILCTGASYHMSIDKVVADTAHVYRLMNLPKAEVMPPEMEESLEKCLKDHGEALISGALTDTMVMPLLRSGVLRNTRLVVKDPSKVLLSSDALDKLQTRQVRLETEEAARTLCVTINPVSAYGWKFDKDEFMTRMREAVDVPVINVKEELT